MGVIFATGFDAGRVPTAVGNSNRRYFDSVTGIALTTSNTHTGGYAGNFAGTSATRNVQLTSGGIMSPGPGNIGVLTMYLYFPTSLPASGVDLFVSQTLGMDFFLYFSNTDNKLKGTWETGVEGVGPVVAANTYYRVDIYLDTSTGTSVFAWWVDGVRQPDITFVQAATTISNVMAGRLDAVTGTYYWDDLRFSYTAADAPLGQGKVVTVIPDTGGTATEIGTANSICRFTSNGSGLDTTFVSADILAAISEIPPTVGSTASGLYQRTSGTGNGVRIPMTTFPLGGGESIELCTIRVLLWAGSATANNMQLGAYDGTSSTTVIAREDPNGDNSTTSPAWWCGTYTPSGGWNQTTLDAFCVEIGFSNDVSPNPGAHLIVADFAVRQAPAAPAAVAAVAGVPAVTVSTGGGSSATVSASAVATTAAVPSVTISAGSAVSATAVTGVASVPAPTMAAGANPSPASAAAIASVPAVTLSTGSRITATAVAATAGIPAPTLATGSTASPASVAASATVPAPSVGTATTVTAAAVATAAGVGAATVQTGSTSTPASVAAVAGIPAPVAATGSTVPAASAAAVAGFPAPIVSTGVTVTLATVAGVAAIGAVAVSAGANPAPAAVAGFAAVPMPTASASSVIPAATVAAVATVPTPTVSTPNRIVYRPNTGTVTRPTSGTVTRPDLGVVYRP